MKDPRDKPEDDHKEKDKMNQPININETFSKFSEHWQNGGVAKVVALCEAQMGEWL